MRPEGETAGEWRPGIVGVFDRAAATYDRVGPRFFEHFGERLAAAAGLEPGAALLDVAAGRGAVLFPAAARVGPGGRAVGVDLAPEMVRSTAADAARGGWPQVTLHQMDAGRLEFPDGSFDHVLCGFALWFFPRPDDSLREFFRVLRPGGQLCVSTWADDCPFVEWCDRELAAVLPALPAQPPPDPGPAPRRFDTPASLEASLRRAGFEEIRTVREEADFVYSGDEEWWASLWSHGIRARLERLEPRALESARAELLRRVQPLKKDDGIHNRFRALFARGIKPAP